MAMLSVCGNTVVGKLIFVSELEIKTQKQAALFVLLKRPGLDGGLRAVFPFPCLEHSGDRLLVSKFETSLLLVKLSCLKIVISPLNSRCFSLFSP